MRWFGLICFIILLIIAKRKRNMKALWTSMALSMIVGFAVDLAGISLGLWNFPGQPFLSSPYFTIVIPCWGVFGTTINMVWDLSKGSGWKTYILLTLCLLAIYEIPNLATTSWDYTSTIVLVVLGWFPLILAFRIPYLVVTNRATLSTVNAFLELKNGKV